MAPLLRAAGHDVHTPDLPRGGRDQTPTPEITLEALGDRVVAALELCREPAVLVGHSMGGIAISVAAENRPELVHRLVYVAAPLLPSGASLMSVLGDHDPESLTMAEGSLLLDETDASVRLGSGVANDLFYGECPPAARSVAVARLSEKIALTPLTTPVALTEARFGSVPRAFVKTLRDRALTPSCQQWMIDQSPCDAVREIDTDHAPWLSAPDDLARLLMEFVS